MAEIDMSGTADQTINCKDCHNPFIFTVGEQKFFSERQFTPPVRCKGCRDIRKAAKEMSGGGGGGGGGRPYTGSSQSQAQPPMMPEIAQKPDRGRGGGGGGKKGRRDRDWND